MESAYDNGLMDGYDDGYYDGYHDALVDNGLASDPPPTTTYADDEAPVEKHLSAGDIFGLVIICGLGLLLIWMVVFTIVDGVKKKRGRKFYGSNWGEKNETFYLLCHGCVHAVFNRMLRHNYNTRKS